MISLLANNEYFFETVWRSLEASSGNSTVIMVAMMLVVAAVLCFGFVAPFVVLAIWSERRVSARMQDRRGPNRVGMFGALQGFADGIKLIGKEYIQPDGCDPFFFKLSPAIVFAGAFVGFVALPFSHVMVVSDFNIALFFILAVTSVETIGVIMGGWASNNKWSLLGALREAVQVVSYEIPLTLSVLIGVVMYGSMSLMDIQAAQSGEGLLSILSWGVFRSPFMLMGAFLFYVAGLASCKRTPFDLPEGESELVAGYHTEYPGMAFGMFFFAEYASMYLICVLMTVVFFGGASLFGLEKFLVFVVDFGTIPFVDPNHAPMLFHLKLGALIEWLFGDKIVLNGSFPLYLSNFTLFAKSCVWYFIMLQLRWTLPRYRIDQVINLCLKVLLPWALVCVVGQAAWTLAGLDNWAFVFIERISDISTAAANSMHVIPVR